MNRIKDNIYYVGVSNPTSRIFDIIMNTDYGTTYNAYLIKAQKCALVEAVHDDFSQDYLEKIAEITDINSIDYIIFNHTEPDHSGSLKKLLEINPKLVVVGTAAAIKNLKQITNVDFQSKAVKTGDSIDLGDDVVIDFYQAPNLHWPDSMFSYIKNRKTVFTCDFLGAHYCEPHITDSRILFKDKYNDAFKVYYNAIMGPFKPYVQNGLNILSKLDFNTVCTSHGPVLVDGIAEAMDKYREWSAPLAKEKTACVLYVSSYGYTRKMAQLILKVLNENGIRTKCLDLIEHSTSEIAEAIEGSQALVFGSPTFNRNAVAPIWNTLAMIDSVANRGKAALVFGSYGWSGEACGLIAEHAKGIGLKVYDETIRCIFNPSEQDLEMIKEKTALFAETL